MPHNPLEALRKAETIGPAPEMTLGMMPLPPFGRAIQGLKGLLDRAPQIEVVNPTTISQVAPTAEDVSGILGQLRGSLARVPTSGTRLPSQVNPEFAPVGGEGVVNAARTVAKPATDALESIYQRILAKGGR